MPTEKAIQIAASCWQDPRTQHKVMDVELATVFAEKLDPYLIADVALEAIIAERAKAISQKALL